MFRSVLLLTLCSVTITANAALLSRAGGQAYYDDVLDVTWVADANLAFTYINAEDGQMSWAAAQSWIASLNAGSGYLGATNWRLPTVTDSGNLGCDYTNSGTDCGFNVDPATGEMAHLYYVTLGNSAGISTSGVLQACANAGPTYCLANDGPFANLEPYPYWSGTTEGPNFAWSFDFSQGEQTPRSKFEALYAWAVRPGDIGDVPFTDADSDGVADVVDNCTLVANPAQVDSNRDGYGNRCDGDLNNNSFTNSADTTLFRQQLGQPSVAPAYNAADINANGFVNGSDTTLFRQLLGSPPGPSGLACAGTVPCP